MVKATVSGTEEELHYPSVWWVILFIGLVICFCWWGASETANREISHGDYSYIEMMEKNCPEIKQDILDCLSDNKITIPEFRNLSEKYDRLMIAKQKETLKDK